MRGTAQRRCGGQRDDDGESEEGASAGAYPEVRTKSMLPHPLRGCRRSSVAANCRCRRWLLDKTETKSHIHDRKDHYMRTSAPSVAADVAMVAVEGVSLMFGGIMALDDVSLEIADGEIVCLLGPSGSGKSTLLRVVAGIERPSPDGCVLDGVEVAGPRVFVEPEHRRIGMVFQDYALFPHLTVAANVAFGLRGRSRARSRIDWSRALLERLGSRALRDQLSAHALRRRAAARRARARPGAGPARAADGRAVLEPGRPPARSRAPADDRRFCARRARRRSS